jgi:hypothetical protein
MSLVTSWHPYLLLHLETILSFNNYHRGKMRSQNYQGRQRAREEMVNIFVDGGMRTACPRTADSLGIEEWMSQLCPRSSPREHDGSRVHSKIPYPLIDLTLRPHTIIIYARAVNRSNAGPLHRQPPSSRIAH